MDVIVNDQDELTTRILQDAVVCNDLEVIDACRGTGIGTIYNQKYEPFDGECKQNRGNFVDGLPIYRSKSGQVFMYAIGVYPDDWNKEELRGLNKWRIASFQSFSDSTTCRIEDANVNQIDFAALGQPYNFFPTIACFDRNGDDTAGFKSSTINLRCNDFNVIAGGNDIIIDNPASGGGDGGDGGDSGGSGGSGDDGRSPGAKFGIALAILLMLGGLAYGGFFFYKKRKGINSDGSTEFWEDLESGKPLKLPDSVLEREVKQKESKEQAKKEEFQFLSRPLETKPKETKLDKKEDEKLQLPPAFQFLSRPKNTTNESFPKKVIPQKIVKEDKKGEEEQLPPAFQFLSRPKNTNKEADPVAPTKKSQLPPAFQFLSRPKNTTNESFPKKVIPQKIGKEDKKEEERLPPAFHFLSRPKNTNKEAAPVAPTNIASRRQSIDPPAVDMSTREEVDVDDDDDDGAIPDSIKNMVSELDSLFDDDVEPSGIKPWMKTTSRQRSLSPSPVSKYAHKESAAPLNKRQAIEPSEKTRNRSFTPSNANKFDKQQANESLPRSLSSSPAPKFGRKPATPEPQARLSATRSRSLERSNAGMYEKARPTSIEQSPDPKSRARSLERSNAGKYEKPRPRSIERTPDPKSRSRSLERSNAGKYDKARPRSIERTPDPKRLSKPRDRSSLERTPDTRRLPKTRSRSLEPAPEPKKLPQARSLEPTLDPKRLPTASAGPIKGKGSRFDASQLNLEITVNDDGSVSVFERKTREDGAIVRSKTTYRDKRMAAKYGYHV
jgi:hypothetical protein